jgi:DNA-binding NtrC family response regulator
MVVDDDALVRQLTVTALSYCVNRKVLSFDNGRHAWDYIKAGNAVDIIISDVDIPGMNGFDLMKNIRETYSQIIFIIMSDVSEYEAKSRREGAGAFLAKPFELNDLFNIVQTFIVEQA